MKNHAIICFLSAAASAMAGAAEIKVDNVNLCPWRVPETLYGIFFEDINRAADGGIYPEKLANNGFEWRTRKLGGWKYDNRGGGMCRPTLQSYAPLHRATPSYLRLECFGPGDGPGAGVRNDGYNGISVEEGKQYDFSVYLRSLANYKGNVKILLEDWSKTPLASLVIPSSDIPSCAFNPVAAPGPGDGAAPEFPQWKKFSATWTAPRTSHWSHLSILLDAPGIVEIEQASLYPKDTFNGRPRGLRKDLATHLKALKPGFLRFPGGCITEGNDYEEWLDWRLSVGDGTRESRPTLWNRWGYWQSLGLGYYEYFCLAEDLGAEPLPVMQVGVTCQFEKPLDNAPMSAMPYFAQTFLDLIEFANGSADTPWGALRARMGHPEPFNLKYVGVGNENWGEAFLERYFAIVKILREKHPEITIVGTAGPHPDGKDFDLAWSRLTTRTADIIDEHYYMPPEWMLDNDRRYDGYSRSAPKVFAGEYACHLDGKTNNLYSALCEAAMMTGFERNSDVVAMTAYAPLFANINHVWWKPNLIWFDNYRSCLTPNYYVQQMYSLNRPDRIAPCEVAQRDGERVYAVAGIDEDANELVVKCVNAAGRESRVHLAFAVALPPGAVRKIELAGDPNAANTLDEPDNVKPSESSFEFAGGDALGLALPASSFTVLRFKL